MLNAVNDNYLDNMTAADKAIFIINSISKHDGKLTGVPSISTSALINTFCVNSRKCDKRVCAKCYAVRYLKRRATLAAKLERNTAFYTTIKLTDNDIPTINAKIARFESFGELQNEIQLANCFKIAWNNEHCNFALWSKRPDLIANYCEKHARPDNLNIIISSPNVNERLSDEIIEKYSDIIDGVYTVYTRQFATENNIKINCGKNICMNCGLCYSSDLFTKHGPTFINELVK